jgi:hypothetical protein
VEVNDDLAGKAHWSRPGIVGLIFVLAAAPIWIVFASFGHETLADLLWFVAFAALGIAYVLPTRFSRYMDRLIPTTAERAERSHDKPS